MKTYRDKTTEALEGMRHGLLERDEAMALSLLSAMAGESMFLLGLPGVGKSLIARRLKTAFKDASVFEYLMSRFSTPDEIFGPVSISKLKDEDRYERVTAGFLPEAEVVFLDEIWKAGPAIQNALLTVLNEKVFLNGNKEMPLPLKGIIAASNELPAKDEGLEALWDRFLIRYVVDPIEKAENFRRLLLLDSEDGFRRIFEPFSEEEYEDVKETSRKVDVPDAVIDCVLDLHDKMYSKANAVDADTGEVPQENARYYISDRRWRKCMVILRTSACLNGRNAVDFSDVLLFTHMLWNDDSMIDEVRRITAEAVVSVVFKKIIDEFRSSKRHVGSPNDKDSGFYSPDGKCYLIDCEGSPMKIRITDYEMLQADPKGFFFASETTDGTLFFSGGGQFSISFCKQGVLNINGFSYPLMTVSDRELDRGFISETENIFDSAVNSLFRDIDRNLFTGRSKALLTVQGVAAAYRKRFIQLKGR